MLTEWIEFWAKHLSVILLTVVFTLVGVLGRYARAVQNSNVKFSFKNFMLEFVISLSITIFIALACISKEIDILTTSILVGLGGHFGTSGALSILCKYVGVDCRVIMDKLNGENKNDDTKSNKND